MPQLRPLWCLSLVLSLAASSLAEEPLHKRIDQLVVAKAAGAEFAPVAGDEEFVRRIYLDLIGRIPSHQELQAFLKNTEPDKRTRLIDTLLASPEYPRRITELISNMLLERRGENPEWTKFLQMSFAANKPWDQLAREIIDPDSENEATRGAAFFFTRRLEKVGQQDTDYPGLTRDVGRLFLGMDLQCAQCHNHLFIDDYKQQDFQGLFIAFQNTAIRSDVQFPAIRENVLTKKLDFMSVFDKVPLATGPRLPGGKEMEIPIFAKGEEYAVPPDKKSRFPGAPKFSALEALAHEMPSAQNHAFVDNIANRLWWVMMGRGLVNPLDQLHTGNPPSHPDVLAALGQEIAAHGFDIRWALRELALTEVYQRSSLLSSQENVAAPETYRVASEKRLTAEQLYWSVLTATGPREAKTTDNDKLKAAFVKAFANPPTEPEVEFNPSLKAALFVLNDVSVLELLKPAAGNLVERIVAMTDDDAAADELYQCVLSRAASDDEKKFVSEYLSSQANRRPEALTNLAWALVASTEFCVNH